MLCNLTSFSNIFYYLQSGTATSPWGLEYDIEKARSDTIAVAKECGCDVSSSTTILECLRQMPMETITAATNTVRSDLSHYYVL